MPDEGAGEPKRAGQGSFWDLPDGLNDEPGRTKRSVLRKAIARGRQKAARDWYKAYESLIDKQAQLVKGKRYQLIPPHIGEEDVPMGYGEAKEREKAGFEF